MRKLKRTTHGESHKSKEHNTWAKMRGRCLNEKDNKFHRYGARGIYICKEWEDFNAFLRDMGRAPSPSHSLDRIDNNGIYCKSNCRWATAKEQNNNRSDNLILFYKGKKLTISQWSEVTKIPAGIIRQRIKRDKWPIELALSKIPSRSRVGMEKGKWRKL